MHGSLVAFACQLAAAAAAPAPALPSPLNRSLERWDLGIGISEDTVQRRQYVYMTQNIGPYIAKKKARTSDGAFPFHAFNLDPNCRFSNCTKLRGDQVPGLVKIILFSSLK